MQDRIDDFLRYMSVNRGSSRNTIDAYRNDLSGLVTVAAGYGDADAAPPASAIDQEMIDAYVKWLGDRSYAPSSIARKAAAVRSFCGYLVGQGDLNENPAVAIAAPRAHQTAPPPMTPQQVDALLQQPLAATTREAIRDSAMLEITYATGMRVSELVSLNMSDLHLAPRPGTVHCAGAGDRDRMIPVYDRALDAVERYIDHARPKLLGHRANEALFLSRRGARMTRQTFWVLLKNYARAANIESSVSPNRLRHSSATRMLSGGASTRDVQELLGHANVSTTRSYTGFVDRQIASAAGR